MLRLATCYSIYSVLSHEMEIARLELHSATTFKFGNNLWISKGLTISSKQIFILLSFFVMNPQHMVDWFRLHKARIDFLFLKFRNTSLGIIFDLSHSQSTQLIYVADSMVDFNGLVILAERQSCDVKSSFFICFTQRDIFMYFQGRIQTKL